MGSDCGYLVVSSSGWPGLALLCWPGRLVVGLRCVTDAGEVATHGRAQLSELYLEAFDARVDQGDEVTVAVASAGGVCGEGWQPTAPH